MPHLHFSRLENATDKNYKGKGRKFTDMEHTSKLSHAARLRRRGYSLSAISEVLGVGTTSVSNYLKKVNKVYLNSIVKERSAIVQEKIVQLKEVAREAWEAWDRSKKDKEKVSEEEISSQGFSRSKTGATLEGQCGDVRFLNIVLECIKQERDLLGLDAPKKVEATVQTLDWSEIVKGLPVGIPVADEVDGMIHNLVYNAVEESSTEITSETVDVENTEEESTGDTED